MDIECVLVDTFHWSLHEIDETDIESLIPFIFHYPEWKRKNATGKSASRKATELYADQIDWI